MVDHYFQICSNTRLSLMLAWNKKQKENFFKKIALTSVFSIFSQNSKNYVIVCIFLDRVNHLRANYIIE